MDLCGYQVGIDQPFFLIAGHCVIESEAKDMATATALKEITANLNNPYVYKYSFDQAKR